MKTPSAPLTWEHLLTLLPVLRVAEIERITGIGKRKIANCKDGKSSLSEEELQKIKEAIHFFPPAPQPTPLENSPLTPEELKKIRTLIHHIK